MCKHEVQRPNVTNAYGVRPLVYSSGSLLDKANCGGAITAPTYPVT
jgi:hypothetical protein